MKINKKTILAIGIAFVLIATFVYAGDIIAKAGDLLVDGVFILKEQASSPSASSGYGKLYIKTTSGNDGDTKLLLHADSDFTDSSASSHSFTANGNAAVSSTQSKFGGASAHFDGSGDYLNTSHTSDWDFGSGNFTIDFWVYIDAYTNAYGGIISRADSGYHPLSIMAHQEDTVVKVLYSTTGSGWADTLAVSTSTDEWNHFAIVRTDGTITLYKNGVAVDSGSVSGALTSNTNDLEIGRYSGIASYVLNGYMDEVRISKGIARWTSNFNVPTAAHGSTNLYFMDAEGTETKIN